MNEENKNEEIVVEEQESQVKSYRMNCPRTANGLSHFVMYGDIKEDETLL